MTKPKILVTGAYGLVGSRIIELWGDWAEIIATNRDVAQFTLPHASFVPCDITDASLVFETILSVKPDVVVHLAAYTDVDGAQAQQGDRQGTAFNINVEGTRTIMEAARTIGAYVYYSSTDFVFGDDGEQPHDESSARHPVNWYGATKAEGEVVVEKYERACIMRFAYPYRAHFSLKQDFVQTMVQKLKENSLPPLFTDQYITPTFIDDLGPAVRTLIEKRITGIVNLCGGSWHTPYEIGTLLARALRLPHATIQQGSLRAYEKAHPQYAHRPLNGRTMSRLTTSLGIMMHKFPDTFPLLMKQGIA